MPDIFIAEPARPSFFGPSIAGDRGSAIPVTSPITITSAGTRTVRVPLDVTSVHVAVWGGGGSGGTSPTTAASGAIGGNAAGYAAADLGGPLFTSGSRLTITVGAGGNGALAEAGEDSKLVCGSTTVATGHGGDDPLGSGGTGVVGVASGISGGVTVTGANGGSNSGTTGGKGGAAGGPGGGAGGAGGTSGKVGTDGLPPGGGGGGAGKAAVAGGTGGTGKVVISW